MDDQSSTPFDQGRWWLPGEWIAINPPGKTNSHFGFITKMYFSYVEAIVTTLGMQSPLRVQNYQIYPVYMTFGGPRRE